MKFGKLLVAGKSVMNSCAEVAYRADKKVYLPKFISEKNPFAHAKPSETPENVVLLPSKKETVIKVPVAPKVLPSPAPARAKLNPLSIFRSAPASKPDLHTVQTELSLEKVKVVHNDLSDADVESVPIKSRGAASPPDLPPARKAWEMLGERLFGVEA